MRVYVCLKQVPDTETKIKLNSDNSGIDETGIKWIINPYDEFAVEEALKLKATKNDAQITVVSCGPKKRVAEALRTALAMGADDALLIDAPENLDSYTIAHVLGAAIKAEEEPGLIFGGKLAIDDNASSVLQQLAEVLSLPHATVVSKFQGENGQYTVEREVEGGAREVIQLNGPSVIGANKGLNQPRYPSLPGIMKAKKKPLKEVEVASLGVSLDTKIRFKKYQLPPGKPAVKMLAGEPGQQAKELATLLREEARVI